LKTLRLFCVRRAGWGEFPEKSPQDDRDPWFPPTRWGNPLSATLRKPPQIHPRPDSAIASVLFAVDKKQVLKIPDLDRAVLQGAWDSIRRTAGFLAGEEGDALPMSIEVKRDPDAEFVSLLRGAFWAEEIEADEVNTVLDEVEASVYHGSFSEHLEDEDESELLGMLGFTRWLSEPELLRLGLKLWRDETKFDWSAPDSTYEALCDRIGREIDVLVAGHTHQEKALRRLSGCYLNSGTWARLIELTPTMLASKAAFEPVFETLSSGQLSALDAYPHLVTLRPTVVSVVSDGTKTTASLQRFDPSDGGLSLADPKGTCRFEVK